MSRPDGLPAPAGIHARDVGAGPPKGLLLHAALGSSRLWRGVQDRLPFATRVFDNPGHGQSAPWSGTGSLHDCMTKAARALWRPGMALIGHSVGGTVALRASLEGLRPGHLILIEPVLFSAALAAKSSAANDAVRRNAVWHRHLDDGDVETAARRFVGEWGDGTPWDRLLGAARDKMIARMPLVRLTDDVIMDDRPGLLQPGRLEALNSAVLLVRGARSPRVIADIHAALLARLRTAREVVIPDAAHMLTATHPDQVAQVILSALGR